MDDTDITPALSAEEWAATPAFADDSGVTVEVTRDGLVVIGDDGNGVILDAAKTLALANHALPVGHPLKITRAKLDALEAAIGRGDYEDYGAAQAVMDHLAALLPPE